MPTSFRLKELQDSGDHIDPDCSHGKGFRAGITTKADSIKAVWKEYWRTRKSTFGARYVLFEVLYEYLDVGSILGLHGALF